MYDVLLDAPNLGEIEKKYLNKAIDDGFVSSVGPFVAEFEKKFEKYIKARKAVSTQSGTAALHLALYELGIGDGDEVIVPSLTFIASINPVIYVRAKPVFVDVDLNTWNIHPDSIVNKITENTKAIIPVHLYGNPCDMNEIKKIAEKYNLFIIEDAAESLGAKFEGKHTGTFGDFGCFSFNGNKVITTGGGGIITGKDPKKLEHIRFLVNQAKDIKNSMYHPEVGFNYRMTNIEASLGLAQMERIDQFLDTKRLFNSIYRQELKNNKNIKFQNEYEKGHSSYWLNCITLEKNINVIELQEKLKENYIQTRRTFMPVVEFPPYKSFNLADFDNSYYIFNHGLCLPSSTCNSEDDIYHCCKIINSLV